ECWRVRHQTPGQFEDRTALDVLAPVLPHFPIERALARVDVLELALQLLHWHQLAKLRRGAVVIHCCPPPFLSGASNASLRYAARRGGYGCRAECAKRTDEITRYLIR